MSVPNDPGLTGRAPDIVLPKKTKVIKFYTRVNYCLIYLILDHQGVCGWIRIFPNQQIKMQEQAL